MIEPPFIFKLPSLRFVSTVSVITEPVARLRVPLSKVNSPDWALRIDESAFALERLYVKLPPFKLIVEFADHLSFVLNVKAEFSNIFNIADTVTACCSAITPDKLTVPNIFNLPPPIIFDVKLVVP